jgi:ABC-2 type transport system ATP-binding protein
MRSSKRFGASRGGQPDDRRQPTVEPSHAHTAGGGEAGRPLLEAEEIAKSYAVGVWPRRRSRSVLQGAAIRLVEGEVVGLVGENGSGKTTLMRIIVGSLDRDSGSITRHGRVGYCPQEPILYDRLTCDEHFELFARAYGMADGPAERERDAIYEALGFAGYRGARVDELSGGTRAKLNLGLALLPDPPMLLLDEPYAGFDWDTYQRFWSLVAERRQRGRALLIVSHFISDASRFDRIVELRDGRTVEQ